jgi:superoxide dismutase, Cu-Zn family
VTCFITDFARPRIYRVTADEIARRRGRVDDWLSPPATVPTLAAGNLNGIAATADGRYLLVGQTGNGALYRVDIATRAIRRVNVHGAALVGSDGILLRSRTLYVVTHQNRVVVLRLNQAYTNAHMTKAITDSSFDFPTSIAPPATGSWSPTP